MRLLGVPGHDLGFQEAPGLDLSFLEASECSEPAGTAERQRFTIFKTHTGLLDALASI